MPSSQCVGTDIFIIEIYILNTCKVFINKTKVLLPKD